MSGLTVFLVIVLWVVLGISAAFVIHEAGADEVSVPASVIFAPVAAPVAVCILAFWGIRYVLRTPQRRAATMERDYEIVLQMIEWKPTQRTAVDDVQDALEIESP